MPCFPTIFRHVGPIPVAAMLLCAAACIGEEPSAELFVPLADVRRAAVAEIRCDAVVEGPAITLRQVARWAEEDATAFSAVADLAVARFYEDKPTRTVQLADIRSTLEDAGVDLGAINFSGAVECKVIRSGPAVAPVPAEAPARIPSTQPLANLSSTPVDDPPAVAEEVRSLREILLADIVNRFALPAESLQVKFDPDSEKLVELAEPLCRFTIEPRRQPNIGPMAWDVTVTSDAGKQKATIKAYVRAWQMQLIATRPILYRQVIRDEDLNERRVLVDHVSENGAFVKEQAIGQQAARDLAVNSVVTPRMLEPVQVVRAGELVNVIVEQGAST